jgi:hypothetical protein
MRKSNQPYQMGRAIEYNEEPDIVDMSDYEVVDHAPGFRVGSIDNYKKMKESEEPGGIADQDDQQVRDAATEKFANQIKKAVSAKLMGKKINLKLKGNKDLVSQVVNMIKLETDYLNAVISGQAADTPALQKNKAILDGEAKKLDRMLGVDGFWPFK